ncbi:MAG: hypothetical protein ACP5O7_11815 [Phycisphaerae bacterium]
MSKQEDVNIDDQILAAKISSSFTQMIEIRTAEQLRKLSNMARTARDADIQRANAVRQLLPGATIVDGPLSGYRFKRGNKTVKLSPQPWRIVKLVWESRDHRAKSADIVKAVWGKDTHDPELIKSAIAKARKILAPLGIGIHQRKKHIEITI